MAVLLAALQQVPLSSSCSMDREVKEPKSSSGVSSWRQEYAGCIAFAKPDKQHIWEEKIKKKPPKTILDKILSFPRQQWVAEAEVFSH